VLHYQNKISASIFDAAKKSKIPVVHRISDFGLICSNALFYRPVEKDICERCLHGSRVNAVIHKCVHDSRVYSFIKAASLKFQQTLKIGEKIQVFVVPSMFTIEKLKAYGLPSSKIVHIPTFFNFQSIPEAPEISYEPFALYVGRIEPEKGLLTMIKAFESTGFNLKIIGFSPSGFDDELENYFKNKMRNIEFLGKKIV
jgi:glycosyltransferase involved in cell wall biosynthesis